MNHYPHHIGDFDRATRHLTRLERSIYRDLIELYYDTEARLPLDRAWLCRKILARSNEESTAVEQVLNEFFNETVSGWYHARCEEELDKYRANNSQKAQAGKASAAAKARKRQQALEREGNGSSTGVEQTYNGTPTNQNHQPEPEPEPKTAPRLITRGEDENENPAPLEIEKSKITPHGAMAVELTKRGVAITSMNPDLLDWITKGVTIPQACEAVALARQKKPEPERISAGYLNTIIHGEILNPKQKKPSGPAWWTSDSATNAKAAELGLTANRGEEMSQFRDRIRAAMERKPQGVAA